MDGEVLTLLNNNLSLLNEIKQIVEGSGEEVQESKEDLIPDDKMENVDDKGEEVEKGEEDDKDEDVEKGLVDTPSDGVTGNDDAEEKVSGNSPEFSEDNAESVAKAMMILANKMFKKPVKKSMTNEQRVQSETLRVLKTMAQKQEETEKAIVNILKGFGIAEQVEKSVNYKKIEKSESRAIGTNDLRQLIDAIKGDKVEKSEIPTEWNDKRSKVLKTLGNSQFLSALVTKNK
jgi:hypothetical protein